MDLRPAQIKVTVIIYWRCSFQMCKIIVLWRAWLCAERGSQMSREKMCLKIWRKTNFSKGFNSKVIQTIILGNNLGPESLSAIAQLLTTNDTIRLIDLEGNKLIKGSDDKTNYEGITDLTEALKKNETLLSLNLNSTGLDENSSRMLREMMECNSTLIM